MKGRRGEVAPSLKGGGEAGPAGWMRWEGKGPAWLLEEGGGGSGRGLMPYAKDADDVDPDADDDDSSSDEVRHRGGGG